MSIWTRGWKMRSLLSALCVSPSRSVVLKTSPAPDSSGSLRSQIADDISDLAQGQGQGVWKLTFLTHSCWKQVFSHTDYTLIWTGKTDQGKVCTSLSVWQVKLTGWQAPCVELSAEPALARMEKQGRCQGRCLPVGGAVRAVCAFPVGGRLGKSTRTWALVRLYILRLWNRRFEMGIVCSPGTHEGETETHLSLGAQGELWAT